jgi:hypothetical protein
MDSPESLFLGQEDQPEGHYEVEPLAISHSLVVRTKRQEDTAQLGDAGAVGALEEAIEGEGTEEVQVDLLRRHFAFVECEVVAFRLLRERKERERKRERESKGE